MRPRLVPVGINACHVASDYCVPFLCIFPFDEDERCLWLEFDAADRPSPCAIFLLFELVCREPARADKSTNSRNECPLSSPLLLPGADRNAYRAFLAESARYFPPVRLLN